MSTIDQVVNKAIKTYAESAALDKQSKEIEAKKVYVSSLTTRFGQCSDTLVAATWLEFLIKDIFAQKPIADVAKQRKRLATLLETKIPNASSVLTLDQSTFSQIDAKLAEVLGDLSKDLDVLREQLRVIKTSWVERCTAAQNVIRIPDLLTKAERVATEAAIDELRDLVDGLSESGNFKSAQAASQAWDKSLAKFEKHSKVESYEGIKEKYGLTDATVALIQKLLQGERISLATVDPKSLSDLYKLKQFSARLMLNFSSGDGEV